VSLRRRLLVAAIALGASAVAYACANPNAPPGGPPDFTPPVIKKITPATGTIGAKLKSVQFQFDEVVSETPKGAQSLAALMFISPKSGDPQVSWHRSQIDVKPKNGWKPNTVYSVTMSAGIMDLHNNSIDSATRIVFSTGGPIPATKIEGVVFDWVAGRPAGKAIVEAIKPGKDSVTYQTIADSTGRYLLEHVPVGPYTLRGYVDRNSSRSLDPTEAWDTTGITLTATSNADFYAFPHDTVGLRIADLIVTDSGTRIKITFDKPVALEQAFSNTQFVLQKADSSQLTITTVWTGPQKKALDSLRQKALTDSILKAQPPLDTSPVARARRDSIAKGRFRDSLNLVERQNRELRRLAAARGGRPVPPRDTTPLPKMKRPMLFNDLYLTLEKPLEPSANYRLTARAVRSASGTVKSPTRAFRTAPKETAKDSAAKVTRDSARARNPRDTLGLQLVPIRRR
jgi:hypothetical protein